MNRTVISEVMLVGFPGIPKDIHLPVSIAMFLVYLISLTANGCVICLVSLNVYLHQPMYLAIANLAASDLLFDTVTLPKLIARYWFGSSSIHFKMCIFQMFWVHNLGSLDGFLLMVMAVDRYVAISQPLKYTMIMTNKRIIIICSILWFFIAPSTNANVAVQLAEIISCGPPPYKINTLFCTSSSIIALACEDVAYFKNMTFVSAMVKRLVPLGIILLSYVLIIVEISSSSSSGNWQKAFYTCTTHLLVVALYFVPRLFLYIANMTVLIITPDINAIILFFYSVVPHMANPVIYFLRTKEIRQTMAKVLKRVKYMADHRLHC